MIYLGADHGGFELKEHIKKWLKKKKLDFKDMGPLKLDPEDDYPVYAFKVAEKVGMEDDWKKPWSKRPKGILLCRSAIGVVMTANRVKDVRAAGVYDTKAAAHARTNDDINVIGLSGDWMNKKQVEDILEVWLNTEFTHAERHERRINQIREYEYSGCCCGGGCAGDC